MAHEGGNEVEPGLRYYPSVRGWAGLMPGAVPFSPWWDKDQEAFPKGRSRGRLKPLEPATATRPG